MTKFWEGLGEGLADRWLRVSSEALAFWAAAGALWVSAEGFGPIREMARDLEKEPEALQVLLVAAALLAIAVSAVAERALARPVQRLLEGDWPRVLAPLTNYLNRRWNRRRAEYEAAVDGSLGNKDAATIAYSADLERRLQRLPSERYLRPTRLGNVLAAANELPLVRYGLDPYVLWPHLRQLLPEATRRAFDDAQAQLETAVSATTWGALLCGLAPVAWWALPIGLATMIVASRAATHRAAAVADLAEAAWHLHRFDLYRQLDWPLPSKPNDEVATGRELSRFVARGKALPGATFQRPKSDGEATA